MPGTRPAELVTFDGLVDGREHVALVWRPDTARPLVRIHSECLTGDVFGSARCDCGPQLSETLGLMERRGGVLLYLRQEGRGIGLYNKIDAYALQEAGADTVDANVRLGFPADGRSYEVAGQMLDALGHRDVALVTNNAEKVKGLRACGIEVSEQVPTGVFVRPENVDYLETKRIRMGHAITVDRPTSSIAPSA
nr:GTP cyclohydrolase II [Streptomyces abyssomicinicus]